MKMPALHAKESERLESLEALKILDTLPESEFDEITFLASQICETPIALVSLVDRDRQWFKSRRGILLQQTPREHSFCAHAILSAGPFVIESASKDPRFQANPLVKQDPKIEFYLGIPLLDPNQGLPIGTLCVADRQPRKLESAQVQALEALKNQLQRLLKLRTKLQAESQSQREFVDMMNRQEFILEGAGLGSWDWWLETNKVHFDKRWCEMLGLEVEVTPQDFSTWETRVHPEDRAQAEIDIRNHLAGRTLYYENIHRMKHKNGDWVWILARGRISQWDSRGKPIRFTGTHYDISGYKRSELISTEMQKIAKIGGWEMEMDTEKIKWTDETYRIHEIEPGTPIDQQMALTFFPSHERNRILGFVSRCSSGVSFRASFQFIDARGIQKWVEVTGVPRTDAEGRVRALVGTFQDVTEQIQARLQLEEAQQLAKIGSWKYDFRTGHQTWTSEHYRIFEIPEPQPPDQLYAQYREKVHPDDRQELERVVQQSMEDGKSFVFNHRVYLDGGKRIKFVQGIGKVTKDSSDKPLFISGSCQDITEKVLAEKAVEHSRLQAAHAAKLASLGEVSAGVAHEINNPLAIINGALPLLVRNRHDEAKFKDKIEAASKAVVRIAKIVQALKRFSRSGDLVQMKSFSLADAVKDAVVITEAKAKRQSVEIFVEGEKTSAIVGDSLEIEQVLINLINNGIDAVAHLNEKWVRVVFFEEAESVVLQVHDSGPGIPVEVENKLFQPFFTTKPVGEGTGLGLSICKGILDNHKASFLINRDFNHTCFEIKFPKPAKT